MKTNKSNSHILICGAACTFIDSESAAGVAAKKATEAIKGLFRKTASKAA